MASAITLSSSSYSPSETNSTNLRDDSFSSYLALIRQNFSADLANGANSGRSSFQTVPPLNRASKDDGELDVFDAEKYFSSSLDDFKDNPDLVSETTTSRGKKTKKSGTRSRSSTCSETSTNSHRMLLRDRSLKSKQQQQQQRPSPVPRRRSFLDVFRCSCSKKTTVKVEHDADNVSSNRSSSNMPGVSRKSLHSELSSDLFEIDSISLNSRPVYAPSEASIEWSVTTASAANVWSVASASERASEGRKVRRSSGLLGFGCVSEKAVRSSVAAAKTERVGSLERYHAMMDLGSVSVAGSVAALPRQASLRY